MGPMRNLEHPGAVMREWWLEGADPAEAADRLGGDPGGLQRVLDGRCGTSPRLAKPRATDRPVNTGSFIRRLRDARGYAARRNSSSRRTVSSGRSCCTQWPAPSSRCAPRKSVQALSCIRSNAPGR